MRASKDHYHDKPLRTHKVVTLMLVLTLILVPITGSAHLKEHDRIVGRYGSICVAGHALIDHRLSSTGAFQMFAQGAGYSLGQSCWNSGYVQRDLRLRVALRAKVGGGTALCFVGQARRMDDTLAIVLKRGGNSWYRPPCGARDYRTRTAAHIKFFDSWVGGVVRTGWHHMATFTSAESQKSVEEASQNQLRWSKLGLAEPRWNPVVNSDGKFVVDSEGNYILVDEVALLDAQSPTASVGTDSDIDSEGRVAVEGIQVSDHIDESLSSGFVRSVPAGSPELLNWCDVGSLETQRCVFLEDGNKVNANL